MLKNSNTINYDSFQSIVKYSDEKSLKKMSLLSKEIELITRLKIESKYQYKLKLVCNVLPNFSLYDKGFLRRIHVIPFPGKFTK